MATMIVPPLNAWAFTSTISATPTSPLNTAIPQQFRSLRGVFKITVTNHSKPDRSCQQLGPAGATASVTGAGLVTGVGTEFKDGGPADAVQPGDNIYIVSSAVGNPVSCMTVIDVIDDLTLQCSVTTPILVGDAGDIFKFDPGSHPYYFSFVMKGGTGMYTGDPGRPFYYILRTAVDNLLNPLKVETISYPMYTDVQIRTKLPIANPILYKFTFPIGITQFTFPTIQRLSGAEITGDVMIKVENYIPVII